MENRYESLNELLNEAASKLDRAANMVRDLNLSPENNIRKIGEALANVYEIQHQIYALRPDLKPDFLKE
jgi:hypothetical protein